MDDAVIVDIRARGAARAARDTRMVAASIGGITTATRVASAGLRNFRQNMALGTTASYAFRRAVFVTGATVGGLGALAAKSGLQFNASMEQNEVAFRRFLGSTEAARREMEFLKREAASTPFELPGVTAAAQGLLAVGFGAKQANSWVRTMGDTIAAIPGGGAAEIDSLVRAIGQIKSKGRLQGDELMQLSELKILNRADLARRLGITPDELMSGNADISASRGLRALQAQFNARYGGMAAEQAKTFNGQLSTLHDNLNATFGKATYPGFEYLRDEVFPQLNKAAEDVSGIFDRKDLTFGQKLGMSKEVLRRRLGPLADALGDEIKHAHLGDRLADEFEKAAPKLADAAAHAAPRVAGAFITSFLRAGPWGKMATLGFLLWKAGAVGASFRWLGNQAAGSFSRRFATSAAADLAAERAAFSGAGRLIGRTIGVAAAAYIGYEVTKKLSEVLGGGPVDIASASLGGRLAVDANRRVRIGRALTGDPVTKAAMRRWQRMHPNMDPLTTSPQQLAGAGYPALIPGAPGVPKGYRPVISDRGAKGLALPVPPIIVQLNGREIARAVTSEAEDARARRGR